MASSPESSTRPELPTYLLLPDTPLAEVVLAATLAAEDDALVNHSIRSFLFARLLAEHRGAVAGRDYDEQLLFAACVLHDLGLSPGGGSDQRFEVDGADRAASLLTRQGVAAVEVDSVWEAIALHTSFGIAERRGPLAQFTREGVGIDFGYGSEVVTDTQARTIHLAYPRLSLERTLVDAIVDQAGRTPSKAPRYSIAAVYVSERSRPPHITQMELAAQTSRWHQLGIQ